RYFEFIVAYPSFGNSYLSNLKNQLMSLGYSAAGWTYSVGEHHIYGSSRTGVHQTQMQLSSRFIDYPINYTASNTEYVNFYRGKRYYELSNHLGNVQVVVTDRRVSVCDEELEIERFKADVVSATDYYPF